MEVDEKPMTMMIYHFNTHTTGGAAIAARRLHDSLIELDVGSRFYHSHQAKDAGDPTYRTFGPEPSPRTWMDRMWDVVTREYWHRKRYQRHLNQFLANRPERYELFSYSRLLYETPLVMGETQPDVVHLHWISGLIDFPSFFSSIPSHVPIVWTLHDMNAFTGGCHYSWECKGYEEECGNCPQLNDNRAPDDLSRENWRIKWNSIRDREIHVVADSNWLENLARQSKMLSQVASFQTIHYGLATEQFYPKDKLVCKRALSIPEGMFVVCFGAHSIGNPRKGFACLLDALGGLRGREIVIITFGNNRRVELNGLPLPVRRLGHLESSELLSLAYSAADVFVIPSLYEAFGQTALESMACGTPVIGSDTGGIPDMVKPDETGLLFCTGDAQDLAEKITWMLEHPQERACLGVEARRLVERYFTIQRQAESYFRLYETIANE